MLGAGAWGTAIASVLAPRHEVTLWARDPAQADAMARTRRNQRYLPNIEIPPQVKVSADFPASADLFLAATPVAGLADVLKEKTRSAGLAVQGLRTGHRAPSAPDRRAGAGRRRALRRPVRPVVCRRGGARAAVRADARRPRCRLRARSRRVAARRPHARVLQRRPCRRRDRRRGEECDGDRRRHLRRPRASVTTRAPRSSPAAWPRSRASAWRWAPPPRPFSA